MTQGEMRVEVYKQLSEDFRQLNQIFWQAPTIIMTITGGLGIAISTINMTAPLRIGLLTFAAISNVCWIFVIWRLRFGVMEPLRSNLAQISGKYHNYKSKSISKSNIVFWMFSTLLSLAAFGCILAIIFNKSLFKDKMDNNDDKVSVIVLIKENEISPECTRPPPLKKAVRKSAPVKICNRATAPLDRLNPSSREEPEK